MPPRTDPPTCSAHAGIESLLQTVKESSQKTLESAIRTEEQVKTLFRDLKEVRRDVKDNPHAIRQAVEDHADGCPALERTMKRFRTDGDTPMHGTPAPIGQAYTILSPKLLKILISTGITVGVAVGSALAAYFAG